MLTRYEYEILPLNDGVAKQPPYSVPTLAGARAVAAYENDVYGSPFGVYDSEGRCLYISDAYTPSVRFNAPTVVR